MNIVPIDLLNQVGKIIFDADLENVKNLGPTSINDELIKKERVFEELRKSDDYESYLNQITDIIKQLTTFTFPRLENYKTINEVAEIIKNYQDLFDYYKNEESRLQTRFNESKIEIINIKDELEEKIDEICKSIFCPNLSGGIPKDTAIITLVDAQGENSCLKDLLGGHSVIFIEWNRAGKKFEGRYEIYAQSSNDETLFSTFQSYIGNSQGYISHVVMRDNDESSLLKHQQKSNELRTLLNIESKKWPENKKEIKKLVEVELEKLSQKISLALDQSDFWNQYENMKKLQECFDELMMSYPPELDNYIKCEKRSWNRTGENVKKLIEAIQKEHNEIELERQKQEFTHLYQQAGSERWRIWGGNGGQNCANWCSNMLTNANIDTGFSLVSSKVTLPHLMVKEYLTGKESLE